MEGRGVFVVLEGIDGAGTTTQSARVARALRARGLEVVETHEPTGGPIGATLRQALSGRLGLPPGPGGAARALTRETLALLFAADRLDHVASLVEPALARGAVVVSDRYYHSSLAYQGDVEPGEGGGEGSVDYTWVRAINSRARAPDLTVLLDIGVETSLARLGERAQRDIYETEEKLARLERRYQEVFELVEGDGEAVLRLDGTLELGAITTAILERIYAVMDG
jgi:dTMP kinase